MKESEADRGTRLEAINSTQKRLDEVDQERNNQVAELTERLRESENDRQLRFEQVQELTERLQESETDRSTHLEWVHELEDRLKDVGQRADMAEQAYHALEGTFIVRKARQMRLIDVSRLDDDPKC